MSVNKVDDKWKKDLKDKLGDYKFPVRDGMWNDILNSLPQQKKHSKRILLTWIGSIAATLTGIIVLAGPHVVNFIIEMEPFGIKIEKTNINNKKQKSKPINNKTEYILDVDSLHEEVINEADSINYESINMDILNKEEEPEKLEKPKEKRNVYAPKQNKYIRPNVVKTQIISKEEKIEDNNSSLRVNEPNIDTVSVLDNITLPEDIILSPDTLNESQYTEAEEGEKLQDDIKKIKVKKDYSAWSFALSSKNIIYNNYHKQWGKMEAPNPPASTDYIVGGEKEFDHPININLTVRKQFNKRWAIESGFSYTYLRSKETLINSLSPTTVTNVKIHNIGFSTGIEYTLYRSHKMNIYSKYGGTIEKTKESNNRINGWQVSTWLAGGISYQLHKNIGVFIEPGGTYYFDNKTDLPTLRNEVPLNFDVTIGLRFYPFSH